MPKMLILLLTATALIVGLIGVALGALPLSAVEPAGMFVDCGPAVFGRPSRLPDPSCAGAYAPLPWLSLSFIVAAMALAAFALRGVATRPKVAQR